MWCFFRLYLILGQGSNESMLCYDNRALHDPCIGFMKIELGPRRYPMNKEAVQGISASPLMLICSVARQLEHDGRSILAVQLLRALLEDVWGVASGNEQSHAHSLLSAICLRQGEFERARDHAEQALVLADRLDESQARADALYAMGEVAYIDGAWREQTDLSRALEWHLGCLKLREELKDEPGQSVCLSRLGVIYERMGDETRAKECFDQSLEVAEHAGFEEGKSRALVHLGVAEDLRGNLSSALAYYEASINASRYDHDVRALVFDLCNVASALVRSGETLERAGQLLDEANALAERMDWKLAFVRIALVRGDWMAAQDRFDEARDQYEAALAISSKYQFMRFKTVTMERIEQLAQI